MSWESGVMGEALRERQVRWVPEIGVFTDCPCAQHYASFGIRTAVVVPVLVGKLSCGAIELLSTQHVESDDALINVLTQIGTQLGRVAERGRLQRELVDAVWSQQLRFGQELHDSLGQELTGIRMMVESLHHKLSSKSVPESAMVGELGEIVRDAQIRVRRLSKGLFPVEIFADGLMAALHDFADSISGHCGIPCRFVCPEPVEVHGNSVATHLFRIVQEAVNNAVKHGSPNHIEITLTTDGSRIQLEIRDDGTGFDFEVGKRPTGVGARIMHYRANIIDAELEITSRAGTGTTVRCSVRHEDRDDGNEID